MQRVLYTAKTVLLGLDFIYLVIYFLRQGLNVTQAHTRHSSCPSLLRVRMAAGLHHT